MAGRKWLLRPLLLALLAVVGCGRGPQAPGKAPLLQDLAPLQDQLDSVRLRGAGNAVLVTLRKQDGSWRVVEQDGWPADAGRLSQYLFVLSQAHRLEAKTANPALYARLGVQPVSGADATGSELELSGGGHQWRLLIGHEHSKLDRNYVRVDGQAQSWLTDLPVDFDRDPVSWLDRRLVDLPLARIARVQVKDRTGESFSLSHRDDRFRLDDAPSAAMHDSHQGDAMAAALDQLQFDRLARDDGKAVLERELIYTAVDGSELRLQAWHDGEQVWVRLSASLAEARAAAWLRETGGKPAELAQLRARTDQWNGRFRGRRFQVSAALANTLMLSHQQILAGAPAP